MCTYFVNLAFPGARGKRKFQGSDVEGFPLWLEIQKHTVAILVNPANHTLLLDSEAGAAQWWMFNLDTNSVIFSRTMFYPCHNPFSRGMNHALSIHELHFIVDASGGFHEPCSIRSICITNHTERVKKQPHQTDVTSMHTASHCKIQQHTATHHTERANEQPHLTVTWFPCTLQHTATHCNTLQPTATHCNTLQHTATHHTDRVNEQTHQTVTRLTCTLQHTATHCKRLQKYYTDTAQALQAKTLQNTAQLADRDVTSLRKDAEG